MRFAPSPTGSLHIGGARTALFNWLFARQTGGTFILRIEDTDAIRSTEESAAAIIRDLSALGLNWDEGPGAGGKYGPYFQSQRLERYRAAAEQLLQAGLAYRSFLSAEERERTRAARESGTSADPSSRYEALSKEEEERRFASGSEHAIVFKVPEGETAFVDLVRGEVSFRNSDLGDFVLVKSDGRAAYNFAAAIDDFDMRISHVLRGEDHLSNTPKQILLHRALGREIPQFGHVPLILGPDKTRLSKRHGAASVQHFLERGFLPEALVNALALLGWSSPDGREILSLEELVQLFSIERIGKTAASFDPEKLEWVNAQHLGRVPLEKKAQLVHELVAARGLREEGAPVSLGRVEELVALVGERMKLIPQFFDYAGFFFVEHVDPNPEEAREALAKAGARLDWAALMQVIEKAEPFDAATLEAAFRTFADAHGMKLRDLVAPVRLALSGKRVGPGLFESMVALGRARSLARLARFAEEHRAGAGPSMMEA